MEPRPPSFPPTNGRPSKRCATASCRNLKGGLPRRSRPMSISKLLKGKTKGTDYAGMPQPAEAWRRALAALDEAANAAMAAGSRS